MRAFQISCAGSKANGLKNESISLPNYIQVVYIVIVIIMNNPMVCGALDVGGCPK